MFVVYYDPGDRKSQAYLQIILPASYRSDYPVLETENETINLLNARKRATNHSRLTGASPATSRAQSFQRSQLSGPRAAALLAGKGDQYSNVPVQRVLELWYTLSKEKTA